MLAMDAGIGPSGLDYDNPGSSSESNEIRTRPDGRLKRSNLRPQFFPRNPTSVPSFFPVFSRPRNQAALENRKTQSAFCPKPRCGVHAVHFPLSQLASTFGTTGMMLKPMNQFWPTADGDTA
jgi:hypothetical protein